MDSFDLIVIGAGPAGIAAAMRGCELKSRVAIIEKRWFGGTCTNDGCVPTRALARTARLIREAQHFSSCGVKGNYDVDFAGALEHALDTVKIVHHERRMKERLEEAGTVVFDGGAGTRFVDANLIELGDGRVLHGAKIIICTGGHPRRIRLPGGDLESVLTQSDIWSLRNKPESIAVVGAAASGCQLASVFEAFGTNVWLFEIAPRVLPMEDELISRVLGDAFVKRGISVVTGITGLERIEEEPAGMLRLFYQKDGQRYSAAVSSVIQALGWDGNIEELNLKAAGVTTVRSYIKVNDALQTSVPHIFAAGDVTGRIMLVQTAQKDGRLAAENAITGAAHMISHLIVPHGGFTDPEYGGVGLTEEKARAAEPDCVVSVVPYTKLDRAVIDGGSEGFCKLIISRSSGLILGAHVAGEDAVETVQLAAAGMATGMRIDQLATLELAYPTYMDIIRLAACDAAQKMHLLCGVAPRSFTYFMMMTLMSLCLFVTSTATSTP